MYDAHPAAMGSDVTTQIGLQPKNHSFACKILDEYVSTAFSNVNREQEEGTFPGKTTQIWRWQEE